MAAVITSTDSVEAIQTALGAKNMSVQVQSENGDLTEVKGTGVVSTDQVDETKDDAASTDNKDDKSSADSAAAGDDKGSTVEIGKEAQKRIETLIRENGELKGRLEAAAPAKDTKSNDKAAADQSKVDAEPVPEDFNTQAEFMKALSKWAAKEARKEQRAEDARAAAKVEGDKALDSWNRQKEAAKAKYPDYDKAMGEVEIGKIAAGMILQSPDGAELAYFIGKNPDEAKSFAKLTNERDVAMALGEVRAKMKAAAPATKDKDDTKDSKLEAQGKEKPKPITPVGGTSSGNATKAPSEMSYKEYKDKRNKEIAAKRRA